MQTVVQFLRSQTVLVVSAVLALASCFLVPPSLSYVSYVDWRVLGLLFSLMAVVAGLRMAGTFRVLTEVLLRKVTSLRLIALLLVLLCFGFSMFLTNDVTLITLVPFTLLVFRQMTGSEKAASVFSLFFGKNSCFFGKWVYIIVLRIQFQLQHNRKS